MIQAQCNNARGEKASKISRTGRQDLVVFLLSTSHNAMKQLFVGYDAQAPSSF